VGEDRRRERERERKRELSYLLHLTQCISIDEKIIINCFNLHIKRVRYTHAYTHAHTHTHTRAYIKFEKQ